MNNEYDPYEGGQRDKAKAAADDWRETSSRFWRYLRTRSLECWGFFVAGLLLGVLLF